MASSKKKPSPLAAFAPLHALAQLVPVSSPGEISASGSKPVSKKKHKREHKGAYILLTDLEPDTWRVHIGHADGRWWSGAWHLADVEKLASGDMSSTRLRAFSQRIASTIVQREVEIAREGDDDFRNMKLVLGTKAKKPLHVALSELDRETAARFAFEYFARLAQDAQAHECRIFHGDAKHIDDHADLTHQGALHPPAKRPRIHSSIDSSVPSRATSQMSQHSYESGSAHHHLDDDDNDSLPGTSRSQARRSRDKSPGKRRLPPRLPSLPRIQEQTSSERAALEEVQKLKAELAKARADTAAAVALASEREPTGTGLGGSVDRLRSRAAVQPTMPRRPGASLANPNKVARRVTAVEFASDSDDP